MLSKNNIKLENILPFYGREYQKMVCMVQYGRVPINL